MTLTVPINLTVLGDIGVTDRVIHIGDEAMFEQLVRQVRQRGVGRITALSSNPADTASRYGIDSIARIGFSPAETPTADDRDSRLDAVLAAAAGDTMVLEADDPAHAVIEAIRASDGVAISGGGNLSSIWPEHIYERAAFGEIAHILGKPLVVSGQTIGPVLFGGDIDLVTRLLSSAALVGIREPASVALVASIGIEHARATVDDASFLGLDASRPAVSSSASTVTGASSVGRRYCAVTVAAHTGESDRAAYIDAIADLLDHVSRSTGLDIRFFAHFGSADVDASVGDTVVHESIMHRMTTAHASIAPTTDSVAAAAFARGADLVITSRYHPAVFAVSVGVPTIGIPVDRYTTDKLSGALANFGQSSILPAAELLAGAGNRLVDGVWRDRAAIRASGLALAEVARGESDRWWDDVVAAFGR